MRNFMCLLIAVAVLLGVAIPAPAQSGINENWIMIPARQIGRQNSAPLYRQEVLSPILAMDRIYKSMQGPIATLTMALVKKEDAPELLWITGFETVITGADGATVISPEFMCHSNLDVKLKTYRNHFKTEMFLTSPRLFSVDQGTGSVKFPDGFGIPVMSNFPMRVSAQVLNHNIEGTKIRVRHSTRVDYLKAREMGGPLIPLAQRAVMTMVLVEGPDGHVDIAPGEGEEHKHGEGCSVGLDMGDNRSDHFDTHGRRFSSFWKVSPGEEVRHTRVTTMLALPYDTTVHVITAHLHPYAESLAIRDVTADKDVYTTKTRQREDAIGLAHVDSFTSAEGLPLYKDHEYEIVSTYNNTSGIDQDAMASMFLFLRVHDLPKDRLMAVKGLETDG